MDTTLEEFSKLGNNIQVLSKDDKRRRVVLISTGAYAPIHNMHTQVFETAKRELEKDGKFVVVAGFISPTHKNYVDPKLKASGWSTILPKDRLEMVKLATSQSDWLSHSSWEINQSFFVDFPDVTHKLNTLIKEYVKNKFSLEEFKKMDVAYLCGADHAIKCGLDQYKPHFCDYIVAVARPGYETPKKHKSSFILIEEETSDVSSTLIRERLSEGKSIEEYCDPRVCDYIKTANIVVTRGGKSNS
eukprot:TRINITY_DN5288_c0_g1_i1.p1 TRINITY_DN5288_c0_g1~~TRINITY_DN5288_c0_g1_i1.p1  ORF type:complete len:245 (+),score=26.18 TRINITY_DN5288_c0_g1_i1:28-762(+)